MFQNIDRLFKTGLFNINPGLERISRILELFGSPHQKVRYVIVGGTNGKGSVSNYLANILSLNGYETGLYTSPHLVSITERIKTGGKEITEQELENILGKIFDKVDSSSITLSFFELITLCAFIWFYERKIDIGILEVGMGGRWDATNVINPLVSVITNVSLEHTKYLGDTVEKIAAEKAEIIKKNAHVVTGCEKGALDVIKAKCREVSASLSVLGKDFSFERKNARKLIYKGNNINFSMETDKNLPSYQINNIAISVRCAELLSDNFNFRTDPDKITSALSSTRFSGRFEIIRENPPLILDGSHNTDAAEQFAASLEKLYPGEKFCLMISLLNTKDLDGFIDKIKGIASKIIITELPDKSTYSAEEIENAVRGKHGNYKIIKDPLSAFEELWSCNAPSCVCGSLYLLGYLKKEVLDEKNRYIQR